MAGLIPPATLEQIRAASDIVDVINSYLPLKRAGTNFVALCPFHKEKSPSFNVSPHRQIFHCFGCHKGGDVFTFVREYENISFIEAVRRLADRARIPLESLDRAADQPARHLKETMLLIHEQITQRWQAALANDASGQIARDYLDRRGVSAEAVKLFRLGYAPDSWDDTVNWARSKGFDPAHMEQAGLVIRKEGADRCYDRFRGRLIFPICDEQGRVIGFSGRVLSGDEKTAKYVNSPETPIFTKGKVIYGLDKSKRALLDEQRAVICEGQLDLIACHSAGIKNVVAPQGTALTADHARILKRYVDEVVLCFDADTAGQAAAVRSLDSLLSSGLSIRVATVPAPHDPDSFIREQGAEAFRERISGAPGFFDFYLNHLCKTNDVSSDKGRLAVLRSMAEAVHKTQNVVLLDKYAQKTALRLGVSPDATHKEFRKASPGGPAYTEEDAEPSEGVERQLPRPGVQEFWLLRLVLMQDDQIDYLARHIDMDWVTHPTVRQVVGLRLDAHRQDAWSGPAALLAALESEEMRCLVTEALTEERPIPNADQQLKDILLRLRNQHIDRLVSGLTRQASLPELSDEQRMEVLREQQALRHLKRQPLQES